MYPNPNGHAIALSDIYLVYNILLTASQMKWSPGFIGALSRLTSSSVLAVFPGWCLLRGL